MSNGLRSPDQWTTLTCQHIGPEGLWQQAQLDQQLVQFVGWAVAYSAKGMATGLVKRYTFDNFEGVKLALSALNLLADEEDHHPLATYSYAFLEVCWNTHSAGGISDNDWICAAKLDQALKHLG